MTKRRTKAYPPTPQQPVSKLQTDADAPAPPNPDLAPFATDPLDAYDALKNDVYCRREMVWKIYRQSEDAQSLESALVGALADSEIIITSTKPPSQQTAADRAEGKRLMGVINQAMGRRGGSLEFIKGFVSGFLGSITGAFVQTVYDRLGNIVEIGIIDPMCPRPYWKEGETFYYGQDGEEWVARYLEPAGIWYRGTGGIYTSLPKGLYYQATFGATGRGGWIVGRPLAEENLAVLSLGTALQQFIRLNVLGLDMSQVLVMNFVDTQAFLTQVKQRKENKKKRPQAPEDRGNVLVVTQNNPDREATVKSVNMRGLPEGLPILEFVDMLSAKTAKGFGLKSARLATLGDKSRYAGSGEQAAQQESDEWGYAIVKSAYLNFLNFYLLDGKQFQAQILGTDDPKAYAKVAYENKVGQTVSQFLGAATTPERQEQLWQYAVERGVFPPSSIGAIAITQSGAKAATTDEEEVDRNTEACAQDLNAMWAAFVADDLPEVVDRYGIDQSRFEDELYYISQLLIAQTIRCIRNASGGLRDLYIRNLETQARIGLNNLVGRPQDWTQTLRPMFPAFSEAMNISPMISVGTATLADLQNRMLGFGRYVDDYANLSRQANWYAVGQRTPGAVTWVRTARESCPDCVAFEGTYASMEELLARTNGRLPGSPALADRGHCKCYLLFGG